MPANSYKWLVLAVVVTGSFTVILDTTVVNVALPRIMSTLGTDLERGQLVLSAYLLALALVVPTTGFLSDRLGTKRLYVLSITGFTLGSLLCGLAWDINSLIVFRFIKGLAGGITITSPMPTDTPGPRACAPRLVSAASGIAAKSNKAPTTAPASCAPMYISPLAVLIFLVSNAANVTAGFMWPPEMFAVA